MWMQRERMAQCMLSSDDRNFWAEIKKIGGNRSGRSRVVDVFVQSYKELFTSVPYNKLDMQHIIEENHDCVRHCGYNKDCFVTVSEVKTAVRKLNLDNSDGNFITFLMLVMICFVTLHCYFLH